MWLYAVSCCCWRSFIESVGFTPGGMRYLSVGTLLSVAVLIFSSQLERRLSISEGDSWLVVGVGTVRSYC